MSVFSAARIAELMADDPASAILPTPEQAAVIEQPLGGSVLVIAGAGSGKTETMANRVVWLVANGLVAPSQVLGLTFTRKAAGELGERITTRLTRFAERIEAAAHSGLLNQAQLDRVRALRELMSEGLDLPAVSTYNSFASAVVQEFGAFAGLASNAAIIDAATAWGIARQIVCESDDETLADSTDSIAKIVAQVIELDHAVSDNLTGFDEVLQSVERLERIGQLPYNEKKAEGRYAPITAVLENLSATRRAVALARRFHEQKLQRGLIEFSDQLALAVETLRRSPEAVRVLRQRTPVVLLDEVQDTSVGQTTLLSTLFAGNSVMAVGDPHQSIYAFRGASASNLKSFHRDFSGPERSAAQGRTLSLSTSWRNPGQVLAAANTVSRPLAAQLEAESAGLDVKPLTSRAQYLGLAESHPRPCLQVQFSETIDEEFASLAEWMRDARNEHLADHGELPTAAVLFHKRKHMAAVSSALWAAGVPNRIVGLGGLLTTPEVTDVSCALRCIWFADADSELLRLLAGPRFRLGVADLAGLRRAATWFGERDHTRQPINEAERTSGSVLPDPDRQFTLLDALDEIAGLTDLEHSALRHISSVGRARLKEAGQMLRSLRQDVGGDVPSLLRAVIAALRLDIELDAAEHTGYEGSAVARANLDAFGELIEGFLARDEHGTLPALLSWLERATEDDEPAEHVPEPEPGTVQLITVHGSKGLEWQLVAIPRLVEGEFPTNPVHGLGGLRPGKLPDELRGDAQARPKLEISLAGTQLEVRDAIDRYREALALGHYDEERRLAYVALTRTASRLLLTGSYWGGQKQLRAPSVYLRELESAGLIETLPEGSASEVDPTEREPRTMTWPQDPLGARAGAVLAAADVVRAAIEAASSPPSTEAALSTGAAPSTEAVLAGMGTPPMSGRAAAVHPVVELLLAEREAERSGAGQQADQVERLTASTFHEFIERPEEAERRRLRPIPMRPYRRTRTGNLFHEWVQRRASTPVGTSLMLDGLDFSEESGETGRIEPDGIGSVREPHEDLHELIEQFERSRWADRQPIAVELEITMPFAGRTIVCKLDAVYRNGEGDDARYEVVDWKSGRPPKNEAEKRSRFLQLDLYRQAYARWAEIAPERIDVTLFYVAEGQELRGEGLHSLEELERLWAEAAASLGS